MRTKLWRSAENGTAAIEFALVAPLLGILLAGVVEVGFAVFDGMQVQIAAEAGALYAAKHGTSNLSSISLAVMNATSTPGISAWPTPTVYCGCPTSTGVTSQGSNCSTVCASGSAPGTYVQVNATITRTDVLPVSYLSLALPTTLTGTAVMRTQ